jgi:hypothetical protein
MERAGTTSCDRRPALTTTHPLQEGHIMATDDYLAALETWKAIPFYIGYQASDWGRIRSFWKQAQRLPGDGKGKYSFVTTDPKILTPRLTKTGYLKINIRHESGAIHTRRVHQLILETFVGPCPAGMVACHDPDPTQTNNRLENLRWDTQTENQFDSQRQGRRRGLSAEQVDEMIRLDKEGVMRSEIAKRLGISRPCVTKALLRKGSGYSKL